MSFIRKTVENSMDIWDACLRHPFLEELHTGRLPEEKFTSYIVQDSIYIRAGFRDRNSEIRNLPRYPRLLQPAGIRH